MDRVGIEDATKAITPEILRLVDYNTMAELTKEYGERKPNPGSKFLDFQRFIPKNVGRAVKLNLHRAARLRILDIGSGPGYFMLIARHLGHEVRSEERR